MFRIEWCGNIQVHIPIKEDEPEPDITGLEFSPRNAFLAHLASTVGPSF